MTRLDRPKPYSDLTDAKNVLKDLFAQIDSGRDFREAAYIRYGIAPCVPPNADRKEISLRLEKETAYSWLYADGWNARKLMPPAKITQDSPYYEEPARAIYDEWAKETRALMDRGCKMIPRPPENAQLGEYLKELSDAISLRNEERVVWIESLRSFLRFIREDTDSDQRVLLEGLFPREMEFRKGSVLQKTESGMTHTPRTHILRKVDPASYPIDILAASEIIQNLARTVLYGRKNLQKSAAEALAFAWLCHAAGSAQIRGDQNKIIQTPLDSLREDLPSSPSGASRYFIEMPALFYSVTIPISPHLYLFFKALPRASSSQTIVSMPWRALLRTFRTKGVAPSPRASQLGPISFLTFLSRPHESIGHRPSIQR